MRASADKWTLIHNAFNPFEPVPPEKLDDWFIERPKSPLSSLLSKLDPSKSPKRIILVGQPASGKSSELVKLAAELKSRWDYLVVRVSLENNLDVERANPVEVLFLIGAAVFKVAHADAPTPVQKPDPRPMEELKAGLETIVRTHTENRKFSVDLGKLLSGLVVFGAGALTGPVGAIAGVAVAPVAAEMAAGAAKKVFAPFRFVSGTSIQVVRKLEIEPQVDAMAENLNKLLDDVQAKAGKPLVVLVDGLDKLRDEDAIKVNFLERKSLNAPACRIVYAGPLDLYYSPQFGSVRALFPVQPFAHVKLYGRSKRDKPDDAGYGFMRKVVSQRLLSLGLEPESVLSPTVLDLLINGSGGVMRDLIRLVQQAAVEAEVNGSDHIAKEYAQEAVNELRRQLDAQLTPKYREVLKKVRKTHQRTDDPECDMLLRNDVVLSYANDDVWFDAHAVLPVG